jgi:hypothetical protein
LKRVWLGIAGGLIGLGVLSGVSAAVTVRLLLQPTQTAAPLPTAAQSGVQTQALTGNVATSAGAPGSAAKETGTAAANGTSPPILPEGTDLAERAISLIRNVIAGSSEGLPEGQVKNLQWLRPHPLRAARLPGGDASSGEVLVWTSYQLPDGGSGTGPILVRYAGGRPVEVVGPLVPPGGYTRPELDLRDENGRRLPQGETTGKPLLLIAPRRPEAGLGYTLTSLQKRLAPHGVTVALVIDIGAPDWIATARKEGFQGPVWRLKGQLDQVPVVTPGWLDGAVGLLIDPNGYAVGSLPLLDPTRYNLFDREPAQIAEQVLQAWGLIR